MEKQINLWGRSSKGIGIRSNGDAKMSGSDSRKFVRLETAREIYESRLFVSARC